MKSLLNALTIDEEISLTVISSINLTNDSTISLQIIEESPKSDIIWSMVVMIIISVILIVLLGRLNLNFSSKLFGKKNFFPNIYHFISINNLKIFS